MDADAFLTLWYNEDKLISYGTGRVLCFRWTVQITLATFTARQHSLLCRGIACYAEQSAVLTIANLSVCLSVRPFVTRCYCVKMAQATIMRSFLEDSPVFAG